MVRKYCILGLFGIFLIFSGCTEDAPMSSDLNAGETSLAKQSSENSCLCRKIKAKISSSGQINPPLLTATGRMRGNLKGAVDYVAYLEDIIPITSNFGNDPVNPSASFTGTWTLTNRKGVLTFRDVGAFEQVPNGLGSSYSVVIDGTGRYSGVSGYLFLNIISDDTGLSFEEDIQGKIFCQQHAAQ